jgi:hypothetical protein
VTTLRAGLRPPVVEPPAPLVRQLVDFLERQSRIRLAVWMSHEHGDDLDQHLLLGIDDRDWCESDLRALDHGLEREGLGFQAWLDLFSTADADAARAAGVVLWEQTSPGADPLDYRFTYEPLQPAPAALGAFTELLEARPAIRRVGATLQKLWKGDALVEESVQLAVDATPAGAPQPLAIVDAAARATILAGCRHHGSTLGPPDDRMSTLYEATV